MQTFTMSGTRVRVAVDGPATVEVRRKVLAGLRGGLRAVRRERGICAVPEAFDGVAKDVAREHFCTYAGSIDGARFRCLTEAFL